jgi:hemoglobin-like flavoprotein
MTPQEITLIKESFRKVVPIADQAAALFYTRLFELDPSLRALFHGDMAEQGRKLMQTLGFCVGSIDRLSIVIPTVRELGFRHAGYHVRESHYETVGAALLWTLEKGLGAGFTAETRAAWSKLYWNLAETMKAGARDGAAQNARCAVA